MLDLIGAIFATAVSVTIIGMLVSATPARASTRRAILAAAAAWGALLVLVTALGGFAPGSTGPVPGPIVAFTVLVVLLAVAWLRRPGFRNALLATPLPVLVGLNAARLGGVFFLVLLARGRLSAPFAPSAGIGDMITGAFAIPLALLLARGDHARPWWLGLWNAFGILDLIVAITLAVLSTPGVPFRVFTEGPGTLAMTTLPWIMIPVLLVPLFLLIHLVIAVKLRRMAVVLPLATAS